MSASSSNAQMLANPDGEAHINDEANIPDPPKPEHARPVIKKLPKWMVKKCCHGKQEYSCKLCGGAGICRHGKLRRHCIPCGASGLCDHYRQKHQCYACNTYKCTFQGCPVFGTRFAGRRIHPMHMIVHDGIPKKLISQRELTI